MILLNRCLGYTYLSSRWVKNSMARKPGWTEMGRILRQVGPRRTGRKATVQIFSISLILPEQRVMALPPETAPPSGRLQEKVARRVQVKAPDYNRNTRNRRANTMPVCSVHK
jgi:hypothetical protein